MFLLAWLLACSTEATILNDTVEVATEAPPPPPPSACGAITTWDIALQGTVVNAGGTPIEGARIWLEDRGWSPGDVLGEYQSDAQGHFQLPIRGLTSVEGCWGTMLDYVLAGERGALYGERPMNPPLINAIQDGTLQADIRGIPLVLE